MKKPVLVLVLVAVVGFGAGFWLQARASEANTSEVQFSQIVPAAAPTEPFQAGGAGGSCGS